MTLSLVLFWPTRLTLFVGLSYLLIGCTTVAPRTPVLAAQALPDRWQSAPLTPAQDTAALAQWWRQLQDPVLDTLITEALTANRDLASAQAKLREAYARRDLAQAELGATVTGAANAALSTHDSSTQDRYDASLTARWNPDGFGANRYALQAAAADAQTQEESLYETQVNLLAELALTYVELRTTERRLALAEASMTALAETYTLTRWRQQAGLVTALEEAQARTQLEQTRAGLPNLRTALVQARHRLTSLLAKPPGALDAQLGVTGDIPTPLPTLAIGIPADALRQRPDVRAAERRLAAQTARLDAATAERYPNFTLSGALNLESLALPHLLNANAAAGSLLAGMTAPVWDAGRIQARVAVQDALLTQSHLAYQDTLITALEAVENALTALTHTQQRREALYQATTSARLQLTLAQQRYTAGLTDFLTVLDSQRSLLSLEDQLASASGDQAKHLIRLYQALGGGWTPISETSP